MTANDERSTTPIYDRLTAGEPDTLAAAGHPVPKMPMGYDCAVHKHRTWVPMERHHVQPKGMGGADVAANIVTVCASGHYETHEFIRQLIIHNGKVPAETAVHFGAKVKRLAVKGWTLAGSPTKGSGGE